MYCENKRSKVEIGGLFNEAQFLVVEGREAWDVFYESG
jgi:hypothetical protein